MDPQIQAQVQDDEISMKELIQQIGKIYRYLLSKWIIITLAGILGGMLGVLYAMQQPTLYVSRLTFVVEESKGGGDLASLAGQFGLSVGGGAGGSIFSGENVLVFLKSESLVTETLLSPYDNAGKLSLADRYAQVMKLDEKWAKSKKIGPFRFSDYNGKQIPRTQNQLLQGITRGLIKSQLQVTRPDKKASFIELKFKSQDEQLSQLFAERLVALASQQYIESKTSLKEENFRLLSRKADSLAAVLNSRTYSAAASQQVLVDANPGLRSAAVGAEITSRDKTIAATLYAEVIKNLEVARTMLNQATPTIQVVDMSSLPLELERTGKAKSLLAGGFLMAFITIGWLLLKRWWKTQI